MNNTIFKVIKEWVLPIGAAIVLTLLINKFLIFKVKVPTGSMIPTINKNDQLFVTKIYNYDKIKRGDILVFNSRELHETLIKRVIGLPGDSISIAEGTVIINGEVIEEDYVKNNSLNYEGNFEVPEDEYFFLGDNRSDSKDARVWQEPYINKEDIFGKALIKVYPFKDIHLITVEAPKESSLNSVLLL
ncbi:signal peptidase I [Clostridium intestinale]|uniref:Signal peptidase I n=1 Tax=Clostridium intestinale TaxID=36845 RepID=A0A7D6VSM9_9CLOT|nr:signal peptidase I [Clostridium intestinale]QLY81426.1 signal peptidase I [Clostridium intestinale]